jgi:hypothetical protein
MASSTPEAPQQEDKQDFYKDQVPPSDEVRKHEISELNKQVANPTGVERKPVYDTPGNEPSNPEASKDTSTADDLYKQETSPETSAETASDTQSVAKHEKQVGSGYSAKGNSDDNSRFNFLKKASFRKKLLGGGGIAAILVSLVIFFLTTLPLKVIGAIENIKEQYFATSQNAINKESETLFNSYMKKKVFPSLNTANCPNTRVSKSCVAAITGTDPVSRMYDGWRQGNLENKLAVKYKIEFAKGSDGKIRLKAPSLDKNGVLIDPDPTTNIFDQPALTRTKFRQDLRDAFSNETRLKQAWIYFKMGPLLEKKYGIKRCVVACKLKDNLADKVQDKKNAGKAYLAERVLEPRSEMLGLVVACVINGRCDPNGDHDTDGVNGERRSDFQADLQEKLATFRATYGQKKLDELLKLSEDIQEKGYSKYAIKQVVNKIFGVTLSDAATQNIADAVPVIGWINGITHTTEFLKNAGPKLQTMTYVVNSTTMVATFSMLGTAADELKAGDTDSTAVGSVTDLLSPSKDGPGAEASPLYAALVDHKKSAATTTAMGDSLLSATAYAADSTVDKSKVYTCNDGKPVKADKLVCPEENLSHVSSVTDGLGKVSGFLNLPVFGDVLDVVINVWNGLTYPVQKFVEGAGTVLNPLIPTALKNAVTAAAQPFMDFLTQQLIPSIASDTMSGARTFNLAAGGGDVAGNDFAHHGIGGKELTPQQRKAVLADQYDRDNAEFNNKSLYAKIFDTDDTRSLASRTIMATPTRDSAIASLTSIVGNPFGKVFGSFSLPFAHAGAAPANIGDDPFSVTQYGYPVNDPIFDQDPEQYWNDHCTDDSQTEAWNSAAKRSNTGNLENDTTNPCLLLEAAADSAGAIFPGGLAEGNGETGDESGINGPASFELLKDLNGFSVSTQQSQVIKYIGENVLPLLKGDKASTAARVTWWSLKEGVLSLGLQKQTGEPENVFGYSNCASGGHIAITAPCSTRVWQVGIAGIQVNSFTNTQVENTAQSLHPGMSIKDILAGVAELAGYNEGSPQYSAVANSTGLMRRSLLLRDPATAFTLQDKIVKGECVDTWTVPGCKNGPTELSGSKETAAKVIQLLKDYFQGPTTSQGTTASSSIDIANLSESSSSVPCAAGTEELNGPGANNTFDGYANGKKIAVKLCAVSGLPVQNLDGDSAESMPGSSYYINGSNKRAIVNSRVSAAVVAMVKKAASQNVNLIAISSFRSMTHQTAACGGIVSGSGAQANCVNGGYAPPGYSKHQLGVAIDFLDSNKNRTANCIGSHLTATGKCIAPGDRIWEWLTANAGTFGYKQLPKESWHWSPTGE